MKRQRLKLRSITVRTLSAPQLVAAGMAPQLYCTDTCDACPSLAFTCYNTCTA